MIARTCRAVLASAAVAMAVSPPTALSASYATCALSERDRDPPGSTPTYNLSLARRGTSCAAAKKVMSAFHRCRPPTGHRCDAKVRSTWTCTGRKDSSTKVLFYASFRCSWDGRRVRSGYQQNTPSAPASPRSTRGGLAGPASPPAGRASALPAGPPPCFGAAARDPARRCDDTTRSVHPAPDDPAYAPTSPCRNVNDPLLHVCEFGAPAAEAAGRVALVGDSHALHWRAAIDVVAVARRWRGLSLTVAGCPFSAAVEDLLGGAAAPCTEHQRSVMAWFAAHPEVSTVFVSQNATTPVVGRPGTSEAQIKVAGFRRAWRALPASVKRVIVLRDTPDPADDTLDCVQRVMAAGTQRPGPACPTRRSVAVRWDTAVTAAAGLGSPRYGVVDLTDFFCGRRHCHPVIGGVQVYSDIFGHVTAAYARTLAPYVLRRLRRLIARR